MDWFTQNNSCNEWWRRIINEVLLTTSIEKSFPLLVTNLNGLFSKISLSIDQTYAKEKSFLQHGFPENGGVQTFDSLK